MGQHEVTGGIGHGGDGSRVEEDHVTAVPATLPSTRTRATPTAAAGSPVSAKLTVPGIVVVHWGTRATLCTVSTPDCTPIESVAVQ